jgi:predicted transcriptional regulator
MSSKNEKSKSWTFVTSHTQVLLCIARDPDVRTRDIATSVGITERAAQRIVSDLVQSGHIKRERVGRRNHYAINGNVMMRHALQEGHEIGGLLNLLKLEPQTEHE